MTLNVNSNQGNCDTHSFHKKHWAICIQLCYGSKSQDVICCRASSCSMDLTDRWVNVDAWLITATFIQSLISCLAWRIELKLPVPCLRGADFTESVQSRQLIYVLKLCFCPLPPFCMVYMFPLEPRRNVFEQEVSAASNSHSPHSVPSRHGWWRKLTDADEMIIPPLALNTAWVKHVG